MAMQVFVRGLNGKTIAVSINSDDSIYTLKRRIQEREAVPYYQQRLVYGGKQLEDENSLAHYHIEKDSVLHLLLRLHGGIQILLKTRKVKTIQVNMDTSSTVLSLKLFIREKENIPYDQQRLYFEKKMLEDNFMLSDYNISHDSKILLLIHSNAPF